MNRNTLMTEFLKRYEGEVKKIDGKWYWLGDGTKTMISNSWLIMMNSKNHRIIEEPIIALQQQETKTLVEDFGLNTLTEELESEDVTAGVHEEQEPEEEVKRFNRFPNIPYSQAELATFAYEKKKRAEFLVSRQELSAKYARQKQSVIQKDDTQ